MIFCFYSNMKAWLQILRTVPKSSIFSPNFGTHHNPKAVFIRKWEFFFTYLPECGGPLKYCYLLGSLAPNRTWLEVFKKVKHVLVSQETLKLQALKLFSFSFLYIILSYENSATYEQFWFFQVLKLWQPVTLQPVEAHWQVVPFWKLPISHCLEPGGHGGSRTFRAQNS